MIIGVIPRGARCQTKEQHTHPTVGINHQRLPWILKQSQPIALIEIATIVALVTYPLSNYVGIWNSHVGTLPLRISGTRHSIMRMAAKYNLLLHC